MNVNSNPHRIGLKKISASLQKWLLQPRNSYQNPTLEEKSRLLSAFLLVMFLVYNSVGINSSQMPNSSFLYYLGAGLMVVSYALNRLVHYLPASRITALIIPFLIFSNIFTGSAPNSDVLVNFLIFGLMLGGFLLRKRGVIVLGVINSIGILFIPFQNSLVGFNFPFLSIPLAINFLATLMIVIYMRHRDLVERSMVQFDPSNEQEAIFRDSPLGILFAKEGSILIDVNQAACDLLGYTKDELIGKLIPDLTHPDDKTKTFNGFLKLVSNQASAFELEVRFLKKNNDVIWVKLNTTLSFDNTGIPTYGIAIIEDISQRKMNESNLRESLGKFKGFLNQSTDGISIIDEKGIIQEWSKGMERISGVSSKSALGEYIWDIQMHLSPDKKKTRSDRNQIKAIYEQQIEKQILDQESQFVDVEIKNLAGEQIFLQVVTFPIETDKGVLFGSIHRDISEVKKVADALEREEKKFRILFESAPDAYYLNDMKGVFLDGNKEAERITGFTKEELVGKNFLQLSLIPKNQMPKAAALLANNALGNQTGPDEFTLIKKNGEVIDAEISTHPVRIGGKSVVLGIARDITERKLAVETLKESEERYRTTFENVNDGIIRLNKFGMILDINDRVTDMSGYERDELVGKNFAELGIYSENDTQKLLGQFARAINGEARDNWDWEFKQKNGRLVPIEVSPRLIRENGKIDGVVAVLRDVTEQRKAKEALRVSETRYRTLFNYSADAISIHDGPKYIDINDTWLKIFGYTRDEVIGKTPFDFSPYLQPDGSVSEIIGKEYLASASEGEEVIFEWRHLRSDGSEFDVEIAMTLTNIEGKVVHISFLRDITERKKVEEVLKQHLDELNVLQEVSSICLENMGENQTISLVTRVIGNQLFTDHFGVLLLDEEDQVLRIHPSYQGLEPEDFEFEIKVGEGVTGHVAKTNRTINIDDVTKSDKYFAPSRHHNSEICVPISVNGKIFGVINAESYQTAAFSESDETLLETVADQLALALQKSRLFQEEQLRRIEAETQREASQLLTMSLDLDEVLHTILDNLSKVINFDQASIHLFERDQVHVVAGHGFSNPEELIGFTYGFDNQLVGEIVESKTPLFIDDVRLDDRFEKFGFNEIRGWLGTPLIEKDAVIGILTLDSRTPGVYDQEHSELIQVFANNAAGAIVKARLFEAEKNRRLEAEIQQEISSIVTENLDLHTIMESILMNLQRYLDFDSAGILLEEDDQMRIVATHGIRQAELVENRLVPISHPLYQEITETKSVLILENVEEDDRFEDFGIDAEIRGWMGVPMIDQGRVIGYVSFDSKTIGKFTPQMGQLAQVLVNQTSSAITKTLLFEKTQLGLQRMKALHEIDRIINSSVELSFATRQILEIMVTQLKIDAANVLIFDPLSLTFNRSAALGFKNTTTSFNPDSNRNASKVAMERRIKRIDGLEEIQTYFSKSSGKAREGFVSYLGIPLIAKGEVKGVLEVFQRSMLQTDQDWEGFMETLATQLALAIDNSQMFEDLQRSHLELTLSYDSTIEGWAQALELRDMETVGHSRRVVDLTQKLSRKMGIDGKELAHIRRGALLHDIGKMAVPDAILQKPGKLTDDEWDIMRKHPTYAMEWLSSTDYLRPALDIPYCHHEKWDGSGYPRGLEEEDIPLAARIFAIIDVYDALISDRPYRKAWSREKTLEHIQDQSGIHFDPAVVEAFLEMIRDEQKELDLGSD